MQSALVRRDAVMLHDPMRTHTRATIVGVVLAALGVLVFVIWGLLSPKPSVPDAGNIVIGEQSGTVYVVAGNPKKLVPTFNLASARLLIIAQAKQSSQQAGTKGAAAPAAPAEVKNPTVVSDDQLRDIPRGRLTGIPDGPQLIPSESQRVASDWAVCDEVKLEPSLPQPDSINKTETTVYAGVSKLGDRELAQDEALLVQADNGKKYLVYRLKASPNQKNANAVRAEIETGSDSVSKALKLPEKARNITQGLLNAIPEVAKLKAPQVDGDGETPNVSIDGMKVGEVFSTTPSEGGKNFWLITKNGIQQVSSVVADIIRVEKSGGAGTIMNLGLDRISSAKILSQGEPGWVAVEDYPQNPVTVLDATKGTPVSCLGWNLVGDPGAQDLHTAVFVGGKLPVDPASIVKIGVPGPDGFPINGFYMKPGYAAVVQSATGKETFGKGQIQLISDRGVRYGVPDAATADGIGLNKRVPAPESVIRLLPTGASLNTQDVMRSFDTVPIDPKAGSFTSSSQAPAGN
ncbi:type VII secretion protein EccB [Amycolatopsis sp. lyj-112]|uniref:type VII secretion protein EccB n=1 Tax=Amycolatopsis sp. lyj-112 TaxID=2789288 RepID=UPI0039791D95